MQVRQIALSNQEEWAANVRACGGNGLHMPEVHLADYDSGSVAQLVFEDGDRVVACALVIDQNRGLVARLRRRDRTLLLPTAPAIAQPDYAAAVRSALFAYARNLGAARLMIQPAYGEWITPDADLEPSRTASITEFVLDLSGGYDAVLSGMHKIHRKNIRRAARSDVEVLEDCSLDALLQLRTLQLASSERAGERTEGFAVRDEDYFRRIQEHVYGAGRGTLLLARLHDETVAALAWLNAGPRIITVRSGSLPIGYDSRAMYLLHDSLIRGAIDASVTELNIGGVPTAAAEPGHPQSGLYEFKKGFGGEARARHALDVPVEGVDL